MSYGKLKALIILPLSILGLTLIDFEKDGAEEENRV